MTGRVRTTLGQIADRPCNVLKLAANMAWDRSDPIGGADDLVIAQKNHDPKLMVNNSVHDMGANSMMMRDLPGEVTRDSSARDRTELHACAGGHMSNLRTCSRAELTAKVRRFYRP